MSSDPSAQVWTTIENVSNVTQRCQFSILLESECFSPVLLRVNSSSLGYLLCHELMRMRYTVYGSEWPKPIFSAVCHEATLSSQQCQCGVRPCSTQ